MTLLNKDFLALTLDNESGLLPFEISFPNGKGFVEDTGILRLEPNQKTSISLILPVGIHGNETGPIELVNQLVMSILEGQIPLNVRLLVIIGNPVAANRALRFCDVNLNRLFSGAWKNYEGFEADRAQRLERAVSDFYAKGNDQLNGLKLHYDLHTAIRGSVYEKFAVYPFIENKKYSQTQLEFLSASGIESVLLSHQPTTTFSYYSYAHHGAHAFTIELGKVYAFGENDLSRFSKLEESLVMLLSMGQLVHDVDLNIDVYSVLTALVKDDESYELNIADDVENFTQFDEGYVLAESKLSKYKVEKSGDAIVFPNTKLPVGQRAGLVLRKIQLKELDLE